MILDIGSPIPPVVNVSFRSQPVVEVVPLLATSTVHVLATQGPQGPQGIQGIPGMDGAPGLPSDQITVSDTPPSSPEINDLWVDTA